MQDGSLFNLWERIGNQCLSHALILLESKTDKTAEIVEMVRGLVETAIAIDTLNLCWAEQNQYGGAVFRDRLSSPPEAKKDTFTPWKKYAVERMQKQILDTLDKVIPNLSEMDKEKLLEFGEGLGFDVGADTPGKQSQSSDSA